MKTYNKNLLINKGLADGAINEKNVLIEFNCPYILKMHYSFQTDSNLYYIVDYLQGGDLFSLINKNGHLSESDARFYGS
jgi:serine/threonine protein kinase